MGKRKETSTEEEIGTGNDNSILPPHKRHKKHKHKKHKKLNFEEEVDVVNNLDAPEKPGIKLKIKLNGSKSQMNSSLPKSDTLGSLLTDEEKKKIKHQTASDAEDEEAWLEALETGKLDEFDEFKRMKDPALMTARQKALRDGKGQKLPYFPEPELKPKEMTEEMIQHKAMIASKRRQQVQAKREKDKKQTLERLLKKQEAKVKADRARAATKAQTQAVSFCYVNKPEGIFYNVSEGLEFPIGPSKAPEIPQKQKCGVMGCQNNKKYSCSKTQIPLCSLECYKKNLLLALS